jgi:16S rRNA (uracil1498-N3)-methyltransferase
MSAHRFFLESPVARDGASELLALSDADVHHAVDVLRLRVGETIDVVEPGGRVLSARVTEATRRGVRAEVLGEVSPRDGLARVTLVQGVAKGDKMDDIVRQAVEVGAEAIWPVLTARSVVKLDARKRLERGERWRRVAEAAAKQAKRASIPDVRDPMPLRVVAESLAQFDATIVLWEECGEERLSRAVSRIARACGADARIALVVGPEGGLAAEEVAALEAAGACTATLGPTILRTETASVVALALALDALASAAEAQA